MATLLGKAGASRRSEAPRLPEELDSSAARDDEEREEREVDMDALLSGECGISRSSSTKREVLD